MSLQFLPGAQTRKRVSKKSAPRAEQLYLERLGDLEQLEKAEAVLLAQMQLDANDLEEAAGIRNALKYKEAEVEELIVAARTDDDVFDKALDASIEMKALKAALADTEERVKKAKLRKYASLEAERQGLINRQKEKAAAAKKEKKEAAAKAAKEQAEQDKKLKIRNKNQAKMRRKRANRKARGDDVQKEQYKRWRDNKKERKREFEAEVQRQLERIQGQ